MSKSTVVARVLDGDRLYCQVVSPQGKELILTGDTADVEPHVEGATALRGNRALVANAWAYAKFTHLKVSLPTQHEQKSAEKRADAHLKLTEWIAELADDVTVTKKRGWCSSCFTQTDHQKTKRPIGQVPAYLCCNCGSPTLPCAGPGCDNLAARNRGGLTIPRYCAEHRHEIPGFAKADHKMGSLADYPEFLKYDKVKLSRVAKLVGFGLVGIALGVPAALFAAPAIGGAVGVLIGGYTGAAATSYGLAFLGGGALAAGGLGMAGGTLVITALGGALGGALGASVMNSYVQEDKSFHIEMLCGGQGTSVIICNGFLSESGKGWGEWKNIVTTRYPDSPVYRVHWGAKELKQVSIFGSGGVLKVLSGTAVKKAAAMAAKVGAKKVSPLGPVFFAADLAKNPWHVAKNRSDKTGVILADLLARTDAKSYVLVGHSLGARAMVVAAQALGTKPGCPRVDALHLLGVAIGAKSDWANLISAVDDVVYNYHSTNDHVLKYLYPVAQGGQSAAGLKGFTPSDPKLKNIDVSTQVGNHFEYHENVRLN